MDVCVVYRKNSASEVHYVTGESMVEGEAARGISALGHARYPAFTIIIQEVKRPRPALLLLASFRGCSNVVSARRPAFQIWSL